MEQKTRLTPEDKITAAYLSAVRGLSQQDILIALNVSNVGRVNEAIKAILKAANAPDEDGGYIVRAQNGGYIAGDDPGGPSKS